jgi:hypothetical protein
MWVEIISLGHTDFLVKVELACVQALVIPQVFMKTSDQHIEC